MSIIFRGPGEIVQPTEGIHLQAQFRDGYGDPANLDSFPQITITQPNGLVFFGPSNLGITKLGVGLYQYDFITCLNNLRGVWNHFWTGILNSSRVWGEFQFVIDTTDLPNINSDGYVALGDDPGYNYSQQATINLNKLIFLLKARLNSSGIHLSINKATGEKYFEQCDIFSISQLTAFLILSLSLFNQTQYVTHFSFEDSEIIETYTEILVQGGAIYALPSKALIEKGRATTVSDNGLGYTPSDVGDMLNSQYTTELSSHTEKLKRIKENFRPSPLGLGNYPGLNQGRTPAILRMLRTLRSRQIF